MKVIIAGSRDFDDYNKLCEVCDFMLQNHTEIEVISGGARGADKLGEKYANERGYTVTQFKADWNKHGKSAGYKRNAEMAEYGDALICFWDGKSKGSKHMINLAEKHNLKMKVCYYNIN